MTTQVTTEYSYESGVAYRSAYFADQFSRNKVYRDLDRGLEGIRGSTVGSAGQVRSEYLPQFPGEPDEYYSLRVARSYLTNYFLRAVRSDSGKILANNVMVSIDNRDSGDVPEPLNSWLRNVDFDNTNFASFGRKELEDAMKKGVKLSMVDYHSDSERPFIRDIDIDAVLSFKADGITGKLNYLKFVVQVTDDSDEDYAVVPAIYELTPTSWKITKDGEDNEYASGDIVRYRNGTERITDELPVSIYYTNKTALLLARSPYETLAELTIEYFQVYSDIKNMMFYALRPMLLAKNVPEDFTLQMIASYLLIKLPEGAEEGDVEWVEIDSGAIEMGLRQLEDIQKRIATFSIDANALRPGTLTATQSSLESAGTNAALRAFGSGLSEHLRNIVSIMYSYTLEKTPEIKVYVEPEFNSLESDKEMRVIMEMRRNLDISGKTARASAVQRKILPPDFSEEDEATQLRKEFEEQAERMEVEERMRAIANVAQQASDGTLAGEGEEEVTDQPRDA